jgi:histone deacetylase 6
VFETTLQEASYNADRQQQNSLVYVSHTHGVWSNMENRRKPSKRYGRLLRSPKAGLNEMLLHHKQEVIDWIETRVTIRHSSESDDSVDRERLMNYKSSGNA